MKSPKRRADWQLPHGVPRGVWDYAQSSSVATDYDAYFAGTPLLNLDRQLVRDYLLPQSGDVMIDWGTGTGRAVLPWAAEGVRCVAVDLSLPMLKTVREKSSRESSRESCQVGCVQANLAELDGFADAQFDRAICLFSTLGMIRGAANRQAFLRHVRRTLKPGGQFALHVHNAWRNIWDRGRGNWLLQQTRSILRGRDFERGDKYFDYRGIPNFYLHTFWPHEIRKLLCQARLQITSWLALDVRASHVLPQNLFARDLRAGGWFIVCR